ncbi:MAG: hydroxylamine reductase [Phycisphaerae bacterium]
MFCYQCEQAAKGTGCTVKGVCGKAPEPARLMDLLVYVCEGIGRYCTRLRKMDIVDHAADVFVPEALFLTVTNVDFDPGRIEQFIRRGDEILGKVRSTYLEACSKAGVEPEDIWPEEALPATQEGLLERAVKVGIDRRKEELGEDITGLQELIMYGLKGMAAYSDHARILGVEDDEVYGFYHETLDFLCTPEAREVDNLLGRALKVGEVNLKVMEMLDHANTGAYGHPEPTEVRVTPVKGKCIVVSGHDLKDLKMLLEQTEGKGINVYTHGEMLPCLAYPDLKRYDHLVGNYGGAWQDQRREFADFPGAILMTTNCLMQPVEDYAGRLFTTGVVGWPDIPHIETRPDGTKDFTPVIEAAQEAPGFAEGAPEKTITIGFARNTVMSVADAVVGAVKAGNIRHFFLVGGCDGAKPGRNYYTQFAEQVPDDCVILTLACGKYRFNKLEFGEIGGIPRLLDVGQCNDSYSAIQIALALANAFDCEVNELPLSLVLSWYEQKAVVILLTLLHLGIENMRLGPTLPAFVTPAALQVLVDKFKLQPISTPQEDLEAILA